MIKMVVSDMDGTLLGRNGLTKHTAETILKAINTGIKFVVATGRDLSGVQGIFKEYGIAFSAILGNGAQFIDQHGEIKKTAYFRKDKFKEVTNIFDSLGIHYMIFMNDGFYSIQEPEEVREAFIQRGMHRFKKTREETMQGWQKAPMPCQLLQKVNDVETFLADPHEIIKVEAFDVDEGLIAKAKEKLADIEGIAYLSSFPDNVEVTDEHAQKGLILEEVIQKMALQKDEVAIFGDGLNDITLFKHFQESYAVANAEPEIKALAKYQILSNEEDGVAVAIEQIIKERLEKI